MNRNIDFNDSDPDADPYRPSKIDEPEPISTNHSVFDEPWMKPQSGSADASGGAYANGGSYSSGNAAPGHEAQLSAANATGEEAERSVWDEPGISSTLAGNVPDDAVTWYRWYCDQVALRNPIMPWLVTVGIAVTAGLLAIPGAMIFTPTSMLAVVFAGPLTEEILKIALAIWVVEKRPWLFSSSAQILFCGLCAGLGFSIVENFIYLFVYIPNPTIEIAVWRWTVCVALHVGCSTIAAAGVAKIWHQFQVEQRMPQLIDGSRLLTAAIVIHGTYNFLAMFAFQLANEKL